MIRLMKLSDQTLIPLGLAIAVIGGGSAWLAALNARSENLGAKIEKHETIIERISEDLSQIKITLGEIRVEIRRKDGRH